MMTLQKDVECGMMEYEKMVNEAIELIGKLSDDQIKTLMKKVLEG